MYSINNPNEKSISDMLARDTVPVESGNFLEDIKETKREAIKADMAESASSQLSDISDDLGLITSGEFRVGNGNEPGDGFSGVRIAYPPMTYSSMEWNIVGINNDVIQFGLNSDDGSAYFAGGNGVIDSEGINLNGIRYALRHYATDIDGTNARYGRFEMVIPDGEIIPVLKLSYQDATASELISNPGFETGDFTNYTDSTTGTATISVETDHPKSGTYSSKIYSYAPGDGSTSSGEIFTDEITVSPSSNYTYIFNFLTSKFSTGGGHVAYNTIRGRVYWYDSSHTQISYSQVTYTNPVYAWTESLLSVLSPSGAAYAKCSVYASTFIGNYGFYAYSNSYFDDLSLKTTTFESNIILRNTGVYSESERLVSANDMSWTPLTPVATLVVSGSGTIGNHKFKVTYVDDKGNESLPSAASNQITYDVTNRSASVTLPIGPHGTASRKLYGNTVADSTTYRYISTTSNNTTLSVAVTSADTAWENNAVAPTINLAHNLPTLPRNCFIPGSALKARSSGGGAFSLAPTQLSTAWLGMYWVASTADCSDGDVYTVPFYIDAGTYTISIWLGKIGSGGKSDWYLDDVLKLSAVEMYAGTNDLSVAPQTITSAVLTAGYHELRAVINGKNASSSDYRLPINFISVE